MAPSQNGRFFPRRADATSRDDRAPNGRTSGSPSIPSGASPRSRAVSPRPRAHPGPKQDGWSWHPGDAGVLARAVRIGKRRAIRLAIGCLQGCVGLGVGVDHHVKRGGPLAPEHAQGTPGGRVALPSRGPSGRLVGPVLDQSGVQAERALYRERHRRPGVLAAVPWDEPAVGIQYCHAIGRLLARGRRWVPLRGDRSERARVRDRCEWPADGDLRIQPWA